jgi:hypothetical protein
LLLILVLALVRGILYLAIMPPWQHYDEPTHFEYVRLIAQQGESPQPGDYDLVMRQRIASSMQAAGFWKDLGTPTIDFWSDRPPDIGISELDHPPLYYALLALPQALVAHQSIETQLYLARLISVLLYAVVVAAAYGLATELLPDRRWMAVAAATFIAFLPPLTDLMSGVNNDVGATAVSTVLLWATVRLIRRGPSAARVVAVLFLTIASITTKSTAGAVAVAVLAALVAGYVPQRYRHWLWGGLALLALIALAAVLTWGDYAARWYNDNPTAAPNRTTDQTPLGRAAFVLSSNGSSSSRSIVQELDRSTGQSLPGHTVTLGAWLKAQDSNTAVDLRLDMGAAQVLHRIEATTEWQFYAFTTTVEANAAGLAATIRIPGRAELAQQVYLDGLVLVEGEMLLNEPPQFDTTQALQGQWGAQPIVNLLKNGSAEKAWPGPRTWLGDLSLYRQPVATVFHSLWDWPRTAWVYGPALRILLQSFWGGFGWNHLQLPAAYIGLLGVVTLAGIAGGGIGFRRWVKAGRRSTPGLGHALAVMGVALLVAWGGAVLRIHPVFITGHVFWPVARYASTAIAPTAMLLCLGWAEIVPRRWTREAAWLGLLGLLLLDVIALGTVILPYYYAAGS